MDPLIIGAGLNLLGGLFGNRSAKKAAAQQRAWALEDQREQFVRLRAAAEKGGFNPLAALQANPGGGMVAQTAAPVSTFGQTVADSAMMLMDGLAKSKTASISLKNNSLEMANARLQRKLTNATLRPKVGGVYSGERPRMGIGGGNGNANPATASVGVSRNSVGRGDSRMAGTVGLPALPSVEAVDPRREVTHKPVATHSGVMIVDNPYFGRYYFPTADGEEVLGGELMGLAYAAPQAAMNGGHTLTFGGGRESRPAMSRAEVDAWRVRTTRAPVARFKPRLRFDPNNRDGYYYP